MQFFSKSVFHNWFVVLIIWLLVQCGGAAAAGEGDFIFYCLKFYGNFSCARKRIFFLSFFDIVEEDQWSNYHRMNTCFLVSVLSHFVTTTMLDHCMVENRSYVEFLKRAWSKKVIFSSCSCFVVLRGREIPFLIFLVVLYKSSKVISRDKASQGLVCRNPVAE